ncbi:glutathione S-transferase T3-like [Lotus japonicus]|uniref:glutathione S-transferase T3-like n=1 Tax=Lotus japonicus TaxID=34305 RepID=UPI0025877456|nr:glutathione S-transferase T3-like [Lotus japonicus]XP_057428190.1 glutathione S-transferase T3-like [Lotus japonicus]XP_057443764.1 glutathione S-transferase T3-like [Lotus japonicus]XP_057444093.1 glutathione S-transferase T3-like [Lotus japonicus]XP_057444450.1 glutathione S-transferase T3-like [Lotus japonicus]XP_057444852.1 glutathione S-transferase T3-like [Lotus japonicus]XP_057451834.1 glutathione S-transferase T3-like [Lotus japonicus]XP_057451929.1 glutathione S-transferase T3-li
MSSYPPQNQSPHTGGNVHNSQYQMFPYTSQNQPLHPDENFTNPQYPMYPPQYQFQSQAPPTGSTGSKVSDTQCEATPDDTQHEGLDDIDLEDEDQSSGKKRTRWRVKDDLLLVQSWLNISKDPTVGTDQTAAKFWDRIRDQFDEYRDFDTPPRTGKMLKCRFGKLSKDIQFFTGCYNKVTTPWKSGHSEKDIMAEAHALFQVDHKKDFTHENVWRMVKDEPKWKGQSMKTNSRGQKKSGAGADGTSTDPSASIDCDEYEATPPTTRPKGKKAEKRKAKTTDTASSTLSFAPHPDVLAMGKAKMEMMANFREIRNRELDLQQADQQLKQSELQLRQEELKFKKAENFRAYMDILNKNTSGMNDEELRTHNALRAFALSELGMS